MPAVTLTKVFQSDRPISRDEVVVSIENAFKAEFDKVRVTAPIEGVPTFSCMVKTKWFNPIVSVRGQLKIETAAIGAKVLIEGATGTNGWFWFTFLIGLVLLVAGGTGVIAWIIMIFMYVSQRRVTLQAFERISDRLDFDMGMPS